ncbi:c-type cytochrome biogenesis protein CcmI [Aureimonas psammosilenae]|uniref:c-type cytochrome biogenesis protein CcmI n=1 Tax=Aureimonas psammosilenae TaxID=2495496 RepID=UPI001260C955|nr:c-type cytochrome biogenesis protein CcmI [Aureimonas psammosilenae]
MFWFVAILLLCFVSVAILWPLLGAERDANSRAEHDVEVYGAQLRELEGDASRGTIAPDEAASARAEIGRRLLKAAGEAERQRAGTSGKAKLTAARPLAVTSLIAVAALSFGLYARTGAPTEPDMPLASRATSDPRSADIEALIAQAEARLKSEPDDGRGWETLLPIYLQTGRPKDAVTAAENVIRLLGSTGDRESMRGQALVQAASGEVTKAAEGAFEKALRLDPDNAAARFYLALGLSQGENYAEAAPAWKAILDRGPPDAPWMGTARKAYDDALTKSAGKVPATTPGPTSDQVAAAADLSEGDRSAMIEGMVSQLAARLESAPNDPDGWKRLMRAYSVLGDGTRARDAYRRAQGVFAGDAATRGTIDEYAAALGLAGETRTGP